MEDIEALQQEMVTAVAGVVDPAVPRYWSSFTFSISPDIQRRDINRCTCFEEIWTLLVTEKLVDYGNYNYVSHILDRIGLQKYSEIVKDYEKRIKSLQESEIVYVRTTGKRKNVDATPVARGPLKFSKDEEYYFRKLEDDTHHVWPFVTHMKAVDSVGIIFANGSSVGTGFRVGQKYVMTAKHVVSEILKRLKVDDERVSIQFGFVRDDKRGNDFYFAKMVFDNDDLDCAILELKHRQDFPPSLKLDPTLSGIIDASILGHPGGSKMKRDPGILLLPSNSQELKDRLDELQTFGKACTKSDIGGYEEAINQINEKFLFHCEFTHGASGSPGVTTSSSDHTQPVCVMMLLRGFPNFYLNLSEDEKKKFPKDHLIEQGLRISALRDLLIKNNSPLQYEIF